MLNYMDLRDTQVRIFKRIGAPIRLFEKSPFCRGYWDIYGVSSYPCSSFTRLLCTEKKKKKNLLTSLSFETLSGSLTCG